MKLTDEFEGELLRLGPDERLIIALPRGAEATDEDGGRLRSLTEEIVRHLGHERVLVIVGIDGAASVPAGARLTDAEYDELERTEQQVLQEFGGERGDGSSPALDALLDAEAKARA